MRTSPAPAAANTGEAEDRDEPEYAGPVSDESFESATIVPRSALADRDVERPDDDAPALKSPPPLEDMIAKIPAETQKALDEIFRARFRAVRRITPDQLR